MKRSILNRVGRKLVKCQRQRLSCVWRQLHRRSFDARRLPGAVSLQFCLHDLLQIYPSIVGLNQHGLYTRERTQSAFELTGEFGQRRCGFRRSARDRLHKGKQISGTMLQFVKKDLLPILQSPHLVHVGGGANPLARRIAHWFCPRLMPSILTIARAADPVFNVILTRGWCIVPAVTGQSSVVRVDGVEPAKTPAVRIGEPGVNDPLRTTPGPGAVLARSEHQLWDCSRKHPEALFALSQLNLTAVLGRSVAHHLDEPIAVAM